MRSKFLFLGLVFLFFAVCVVGLTDTKSVVLRIGIWDLTEDNPIHTRAEIWIRGVGSWYFKRALSEGESAKKFEKYPVGVKQKFFFYPESRKGKELIISFMMTEDMNPNGSVRDTLWVSFYDEEVEVSGLPITAATGKSELKFKRKEISEDTIVYITRTGKKYHTGDCRYLSKSKIPVSLKEAIQRGYTPCLVCGPQIIETQKQKIEKPKAVDTSASVTVYITRTGKKYHRDSCSYLRRSKIRISLKDACARGYTPCSRCNPPKCK